MNRLEDAWRISERSLEVDTEADLLRRPAPTRVLLRSARTGLYYGREGRWVAEQEDALDFTRVEEAYQACWRESFSDMVVALRTERPPCELKLPVPQDQMSWSHGVVE
jgi:hypothetical protein